MMSEKIKSDHGDFGALTHESAYLTTIYDERIRTRMQRYYLAWTLNNVILSIYIIILLCYFWHYFNKLQCIHRLEVWLLVYMVLQVLHLIRSIVIICIWKRAKDPTFG